MNYIYDFKSKELTQEVIFDNMVDFVMSLVDIYNDLRRDEFVAIYTTNEFVKELIEIYDVDVSEQYLEDEFYIMTIAYDGNITIEPMIVNNNIVLPFATITMFDASCPTRILKNLEYNEENILIYDFDEEI